MYEYFLPTSYGKKERVRILAVPCGFARISFDPVGISVIH